MDSILKDYTNLYNILVDVTNNNKYNYESYCNKKSKSVGKNLDTLKLEDNQEILEKIGNEAFCCIKEYRDSNSECDFDTSKTVELPNITDWTKWGDISSYLTKIHNATNNIIQQNTGGENTNLDIQVNLLKQKSGYVKTAVIVFAILYIVILFMVFKNYIWAWRNLTYNEKYNIRGTFKSYICDGISIILLMLYVGKVFILTNLQSFSSSYKEYTDNLINIEQHEITEMIRTIEDINSSITMILCNENCDNGNKPEDRYKKSRDELKSKIDNFVNTYKKLQKKQNSTGNVYTKTKLLNSINGFFGDLKGLIYRENNKFNTLVVNNSPQIECLMKLVLLNKCDNDTSLKCYLNNQCGLHGFLDLEKYDGDADFKNGLEDINKNDADQLFDIFTKKPMNSVIRFELQHNKLYKVIENIFIFKIKYYNLRKEDFTIYINNYFHKLNLVENGITLDKFDIIRNYKTLIDIIYTNYSSQKKIENKVYPKTVIDKNKFRLIMNLYSTTDINKIRNNLSKTTENIISYKKLFSKQIKDEIDNEKTTNNNMGMLVLVVSLISVLQFAGIAWNTGVFDDDLKESNLEKLRGMRDELRKQKKQEKIEQQKRSDELKRQRNQLKLEKQKLGTQKNIELAKADALTKRPIVPGAIMPGTMTSAVTPSMMSSTLDSQRGGVTRNNVIEEDQKLKKPIAEKQFPLRVSKLTAMLSVIVLVNTILGSYWFKQGVNTTKREMILLNSENEFEDKLRDLDTYLSKIIIIKKIDQYSENKKDIDNILNELDIKVNSEDGKLLFSKHSKENDYIILDKTDIKELVYEELYDKLINLLELYNCCFIAKQDKKVIFPWTELSINVILYLLSLGILGYVLTTDELKPDILIEKLSGHYKKVMKQLGGANDNSELDKLENDKDILLYIIITLVSSYFSYNIYSSTMDYKKYMFN
jgi:hypothetical protein